MRIQEQKATIAIINFEYNLTGVSLIKDWMLKRILIMPCAEDPIIICTRYDCIS